MYVYMCHSDEVCVPLVRSWPRESFRLLAQAAILSTLVLLTVQGEVDTAHEKFDTAMTKFSTAPVEAGGPVCVCVCVWCVCVCVCACVCAHAMDLCGLFTLACKCFA